MSRARRPKARPTVIPMVKLKPWQITLYTYLEFPTRREIDRSKHITNTKENRKTYTGKITRTSLTNLKAAIKLLIAQSKEKEALNFKTGTYFKFRCNFITLTLSTDQGSWGDKSIKSKLFDPWMKKAKRWFDLKNYVWRAERQKNSNIHFHLITDTYIDHKQLRDSWNESQQLLHFIDAFEKKNGHRNPNSTDVHSIRKIKDLAAYICKYMTKKGADENVVEGKVWGCSSNLSKYKNTSLIIDSSISEEVRTITQKFAERKFDTEFASIYSFSEKEFNDNLPPILKSEWNKFIKQVSEPPTQGEE